MDEFVQWLSAKLKLPIGGFLGKGVDGMVFELGEDRVIKIKTNTDDLDPLIDLSHQPIPGVVRIFKVGMVEVPARLAEKLKTDKLAYVIMEKLYPSKELEGELQKIGSLWKTFAAKVKAPRYGMGIHILRDLAIGEDKQVLKQFAEHVNEEHPDLIQTLLEIMAIFKWLQKHGINWGDVHHEQFAYNKDGDITAFDIDYRGNEHLGLDVVPMNLKQVDTIKEQLLKRFIREVVSGTKSVL